MEEFLGYSVRGSRGQVMKSWKDKKKVLVWLNRKSGIHCVWRHGFKKVVRLKDKAPDVWMEKFRCYEEDEDVLVNQNRRDRDTGLRLYPPTCGYCRFLEDIRQEVQSKNVDWCTPVFRFDAGNKVEVLHAGGIIGFFKSDKLTDEEKAEMAAVNVYQKTAFKEETRAKAEFIFCVVDDADPRSGVQMTIEPVGLGDKMKRAIGDQLKARREKGDPTKNPYPFLWEYFADASFDDAYSVVAMVEEVPSPEVARLIDGPGPDIAPIIRASPQAQVRAMLEEYDVMGIDWKGYFPDVPEVGEVKDPGAKAHEVRGPAADDVACDECGKAMSAAATKCPSCGKAYEVEEAAAKPPSMPAPPPPKKAEAKAPESPPAKHAVSDAFGGGDDEIPF